MKKYFFLIIIIFLFVGCGKEEQQVEKSKKTKSLSVISSHQLLNKKSDEIPLANSNQKFEKEKKKPAVASNKIISKAMEKFTKDVLNCSNEEKLSVACEKLHLKRLTKEEIAKPGIYTMDDVVNKMFDISRSVTSNDIADLCNLDQRKLVELIEKLLEYYLPPERYVIILEVCLRKNNEPYVLLKASDSISYVLLQPTFDDLDNCKERERRRLETLESAVKLSLENENNPELKGTILQLRAELSADYWNKGEYEKSINLADDTINFALRNPNDYNGSLIGNALLKKINCLMQMGKTKDAYNLLEEAKNRKDINEVYRKEFNIMKLKKKF